MISCPLAAGKWREAWHQDIDIESSDPAMMERHEIENQEAHDIASQLTAAFDEHCAKTSVAG